MKIIDATDGTRLAVYDFNPYGKEAVVLLHGWPLSHKMYEYQIGRLLKCGYRVVALDLRGFGASDTPDRVYSFNQMATTCTVSSSALACAASPWSVFRWAGRLRCDICGCSGARA